MKIRALTVGARVLAMFERLLVAGVVKAKEVQTRLSAFMG